MYHRVEYIPQSGTAPRVFKLGFQVSGKLSKLNLQSAIRFFAYLRAPIHAHTYPRAPPYVNACVLVSSYNWPQDVSTFSHRFAHPSSFLTPHTPDTLADIARVMMRYHAEHICSPTTISTSQLFDLLSLSSASRTSPGHGSMVHSRSSSPPR